MTEFEVPEELFEPVNVDELMEEEESPSHYRPWKPINAFKIMKTWRSLGSRIPRKTRIKKTAEICKASPYAVALTLLHRSVRGVNRDLVEELFRENHWDNQKPPA